MKNVVELHVLDVSQSPGVFAMELHCQFWSEDFGGGLPGIVFAAISVKTLNLTVEYAFQLEAYI